MTEDTTETAEAPELVDAPEIPEDQRTGRYAVYNRTLGQYVGFTTTADKPTQRDATSQVPDGHVAVVVPV